MLSGIKQKQFNKGTDICNRGHCPVFVEKRVKVYPLRQILCMQIHECNFLYYLAWVISNESNARSEPK